MSCGQRSYELGPGPDLEDVPGHMHVDDLATVVFSDRESLVGNTDDSVGGDGAAQPVVARAQRRGRVSAASSSGWGSRTQKRSAGVHIPMP